MKDTSYLYWIKRIKNRSLPVTLALLHTRESAKVSEITDYAKLLADLQKAKHEWSEAAAMLKYSCDMAESSERILRETEKNAAKPPKIISGLGGSKLAADIHSRAKKELPAKRAEVRKWKSECAKWKRKDARAKQKVINTEKRVYAKRSSLMAKIGKRMAKKADKRA